MPKFLLDKGRFITAYLDGNDFVWSDSKDSTCIEKSLCVDGITDTIGVGMEHTFKFE